MASDDEIPIRCIDLAARLNALKILIDEREDRTKERFAAMEKNIVAALAASDKAVTKAETAIEKRFDSVNEFRETLRDQAANLMPRSEYDVRHKTLENTVHGVSERLTGIEARTAGITAANIENRRTHTDSSARMMAILGIGIAASVGLLEIFARIAMR